MCFVNSSEVTLSFNDWSVLFPSGVPDVYTGGNRFIEILSSNIKNGIVKEGAIEAIMKNAENAKKDGSCQPTGVFPWLAAQKNEGER